ncbi:hydrolase psoB [Aspergillus ruber CBS 135680]|uniref:Alpha/beta-hydrolase n=1 Tax=Aspergillus ruber (strain CBS 135680) TaxID=1388766 RepID=A0A017SKD6_ASPRC|nr:alpha/beta-hydrolase [Aspergillus ruber CBS 135680]EYE97064.1 alpha/beta-hydrolase [Aspergillus ruber CBS 135680]
MLINHFFKSNECFSYEVLRAAGYANYGGADLGEVISITSKIRAGDEDDWLREWKSAADRAFANAKNSALVGNKMSAYEGYLRASNYYRTAEFFRRDDFNNDKIAHIIYERSETAFAQAMELSTFKYQSISIPYEDMTLPGYFVSPDATGTPRRTIIFNGGYDSTMSEGWFAIGAAALSRGYNFLAFDGPGQGATIRSHRLFFRPDWEKVLTPVVDYTLTRKEVDPNAITIFGWSMGGYLVSRAATEEHRIQAIILDDGVYDFGSAFRVNQPWFVQKLVDLKYDSVCNFFFRCAQSLSTGIRWGLRNGKWTFGVTSEAEMIRTLKDYTLEGICQKITTPCLILDAENDHFLKGQPDLLRRHLSCEHEFVSLRQDEGGDTHCHQGTFFRVHQVVFDFLEKRLGS